MEIVVPAAGLSTRFPGTRPKYLLYTYDGILMLRKALEPFIGHNKITIGILKGHDELYNARKVIRREVGEDVEIVMIDTVTRGPADTVYQILKNKNYDVPFLVKDCDNFFNIEHAYGNVVYTSDVKDHEILRRLGSKSFCITNDQDVVLGVVEKEIVSNRFCVGAYQFQSSDSYKKAFESLSNDFTKEIFVSHIISKLIDDGEVFLSRGVSNYVDVGTLEEWAKYNDKPTIFCDIDGTLVKAMYRPYTDPYVILDNNYKVIKAEYDRGCQIIFTTARPDYAFDTTLNMLHELGFYNCKLIMGLHNARRILINDYNVTNRYPSALAYNLKRDGDELNGQYQLQV